MSSLKIRKRLPILSSIQTFQDFFIESIISEVGFRGVLCESYDEFEVRFHFD